MKPYSITLSCTLVLLIACLVSSQTLAEIDEQQSETGLRELWQFDTKG